MSTLKEQIEELKVKSMKAKIGADTDEAKAEAELNLSVARALLAAVGEAETAGKVRRELSEDDVLALLKSEAKKRRGSAEIYGAVAGAEDRATREAAEADVVEAFLPKAATEQELESFITGFVADNGLAGAGKQAVGQVMKALRGEFTNFDGKVASALAAKLTA